MNIVMTSNDKLTNNEAQEIISLLNTKIKHRVGRLG